MADCDANKVHDDAVAEKDAKSFHVNLFLLVVSWAAPDGGQKINKGGKNSERYGKNGDRYRHQREKDLSLSPFLFVAVVSYQKFHVK